MPRVPRAWLCLAAGIAFIAVGKRRLLRRPRASAAGIGVGSGGASGGQGGAGDGRRTRVAPREPARSLPVDPRAARPAGSYRFALRCGESRAA